MIISLQNTWSDLLFYPRSPKKDVEEGAKIIVTNEALIPSEIIVNMNNKSSLCRFKKMLLQTVSENI